MLKIFLNPRFLWGFIAVLALVMTVVLASYYVPAFGNFIKSGFTGEEAYYAVYMDSGDVYFGKFKSRFKLTDVYILSRNPAGENQPYLSKLSDVFWGPSGEMVINPQKISWISKLSRESQVLSYIRAQK